MTEQEIEQLARDQWDILNLNEGLDGDIKAAAWMHWKLAWETAYQILVPDEDAAKVLVQQGYTEEDMFQAWRNGEINGSDKLRASWLGRDEEGAKSDYEDWIKQYNEANSKEQ